MYKIDKYLYTVDSILELVPVVHTIQYSCLNKTYKHTVHICYISYISVIIFAYCKCSFVFIFLIPNLLSEDTVYVP